MHVLEFSIYLNQMHGSNTCFVWKMDLTNVYGKY